MSKPILCLDFDGVIHSYTSGWKGAHVVSDPPVPGAIDFIREATKHFRVAIFSTRTHQIGGGSAMRKWLFEHIMEDEGGRVAPDWAADIEWPPEKPPALVSIDDRAITFTGKWPSMDELINFKPWNRK